MQCVDLPDQWIVVAQCAGARGEDIAIQRVFEHCETIKLPERDIEQFRFWIDGAQRQPGQQQDQKGYDRDRRCNPHCDAPTTGTPR